MALLPVILICLLFGSAPLLFASFRMIRRWGVGLWIFSPLPAFLFAYIVAFGLLPFGQSLFEFQLYPSLTFDYDSFVLAEILGAVASYAFVAGFTLLADPKPPAAPTPVESVSAQEAVSPRMASPSQKAAFVLSILLQTVFILFMFQAHALTLNLGANRQAYLNALIGAGYINLLNGVSTNLLMIGLLLSIWTRRLGFLGILALLFFLIPNVLITTRSAITSLLFLLMFAYFVNSFRARKKIKLTWIVLLTILVVFLGSLLGSSRRGSDETEDIPNPIPAALQPVVYLSLTFDMEVLLEQSLHNTNEFQFGSTWFEDIVYTYMPRALVPDKPLLFGTTRAQAIVAPSITNNQIDLISTFPIGIYGEAYLNFGIPGVLIILFLLGMMLKFIFNRCLQLVFDRKINWTSLFFMVTYAGQCSNSLGYIRGVGPFLASLLFTSLLLYLCIALLQFIGRGMTAPGIQNSAA